MQHMNEGTQWPMRGLRAFVTEDSLHVRRFARAITAMAVAALALPLQAAPAPPSLVQALKAAEATLQLIPGDDIELDFRPAWTGVADLDGDGGSEIIYFYTSTYTGGTFAQRNTLP